MKEETYNGPGSPKYIETAKRDFHNVLKRTPLNTPCSISGLEFEFDLDWPNLKPLLDKHCEYSINADKIVIKKVKEDDEVPEKPESPEETKQHNEYLIELENFFYKTGTYRRVRTKNLKNINEKLKQALNYGLKHGMVLYEQDIGSKEHIFFLHHYVRFRTHKPK